MPQLSLYLDGETMERLRQRAGEKHVSLSKYVSDLVKQDLGKGWPPGFFDLYGSIDDETFTEPEEIPWEYDAPRPWDNPSWQGLFSGEDGEPEEATAPSQDEVSGGGDETGADA